MVASTVEGAVSLNMGRKLQATSTTEEQERQSQGEGQARIDKG